MLLQKQSTWFSLIAEVMGLTDQMRITCTTTTTILIVVFGQVWTSGFFYSWNVISLTVTEMISGTGTIIVSVCWCKVDVNNAGEGELEIMINKGTVANSVRMISTGLFQVSFVPKEPKPHTVDIKFNSTALPGLLLSLSVCFCDLRCPAFHAPCGAGTPLFPLCPFTSSSLRFLYFSLSFIGFTYFLFLSIPSLSTRIVPLRFQAGGRRRRPNLGLVCVLLCNLCYL